MPIVSIVIPSRNEPFLDKTVKDILAKARGEIEIIIILDGYWVGPDELPQDNRIHIIHRGDVRGMRNGINSAVAIAKGKYIMKLDAHCMLDEGFDVKLAKKCRENWILIPTRKRLDPDNWEVISDSRRDINYMELVDFRGRIDEDRNNDVSLDSEMLVDTMAFQGSCYFMTKETFNYLGLLDDVNFGGSGHEAQEIAFKAKEKGAKLARYKGTWYAHWHKGKRGGGLPKQHVAKSRAYFKKWINPKEDEKERVRDKHNPEGKEFPVIIKKFKRRHLLHLFKDLGYKKGAEIGVRSGKFSELMCQLIPNIDLMSVDPYDLVFEDSRSHRMGMEKTNYYFKMATDKLAKYPGCRLIKEESLKAVADIPYESLDFVYIDGSHEFDYVMADIIEWAKRVRKGGIVSGHDYYKFPNAGVVDAVDTYIRNHEIEEWYLTNETASTWFWVK